MPPRTLIHVRHGETFWNAARRLQGWQDIDLNETGRAQARRNGPVVASELARLGLGHQDVAWVASPLRRARDTMEAVRRGVGIAPDGYATDPRLREISYGIYEGLTHDEIAARAPADYHWMLEDKWGFKPPQGESYYDLRDRVAAVLDGLPEAAVIVAHGGVLRAIRAILEDRTDREIVDAFVPQDQIFVWSNDRGHWV